MSAYLALVCGFGVLILSGDVLVRSSVGLALRLGVPSLVVAMTIVAFGTSAPELFIAVSSTLDGKAGLAIGNVVGANIVNVLLVLGLPAMILGMAPRDGDTRQATLVMVAASFLFAGVALTGQIGRWAGLVFVGCLAATMINAILAARRLGVPAPVVSGRGGPAASILLLVLGLAGLPIGAHFVVDSATRIAQQFDVPEHIIGLTVVAWGTTLPELVTAVMAALRRQADVALGNVIGSNIFNILGVLGVAALVRPMPVPVEIFRLDLWAMIAVGLLLVPFTVFGRPLTRTVGACFAVLYALFFVVHL